MERPKLARRSKADGAVLLGLCAGLGDHLGYDPVLIRLILILLLVLSPAGLAVAIVYLIFAWTLPVETREAG